jgi:hypothetical protein
MFVSLPLIGRGHPSSACPEAPWLRRKRSKVLMAEPLPKAVISNTLFLEGWNVRRVDDGTKKNCITASRAALFLCSALKFCFKCVEAQGSRKARNTCRRCWHSDFQDADESAYHEHPTLAIHHQAAASKRRCLRHLTKGPPPRRPVIREGRRFGFRLRGRQGPRPAICFHRQSCR